MGSPLLFFSQPPPNPDHRVLPKVGPETKAPFALLNIANEVFTHWTYWVAPTAPFVSGGAPVTLKPYCPLPKPSKPRLTTGANTEPEMAVLCRTGSSGSVVRPGGRGIRRAGSASCTTIACFGAI